MKVTQEKLPASQVALEIEIPPEMSKRAYEQVIQEFTRSVDIPGFRKGKVPRQVLIQRFGSSRIKAAAVEELVQDGIQQAVKQEEIEAIGSPQLKTSFDELVSRYEPGSALTFSATVDVQPEVTLNQHTGLQVQAEEVKYDPAKVDQVLEDYRSRSAALIPVEGRPAERGDVAVVDYVGRVTRDGGESEEFPGGQAEDFQVELVEGRFIEGFIDGIFGMNPGETKEVSVQFPEGYPQEDLAGQPAVFTITLKELKAKDLPELDDDFAQDISEFETLEELRNSLETRYREEAEETTKANKEAALIDALVQHLEVDLPETLVDRELEYMLTQTAMRLQNQGVDIKKLLTREVVTELRERSRPEAIGRIKRTLALGEVAKKESIQVDEDAVLTRMNEVMTQYGDRQFDPERLREVITEEILTEKIVSWLEEHSTIELVPEGTLTKPEDESEVPDTGVSVAEAETPESLTVEAESPDAPAAEAVIEVSSEEVSDTSVTDSPTAETIEAVDTTASDAQDAEAAIEPESTEDKPAKSSRKKKSASS
jgi:trigger factor